MHSPLSTPNRKYITLSYGHIFCWKLFILFFKYIFVHIALFYQGAILVISFMLYISVFCLMTTKGILNLETIVTIEIDTVDALISYQVFHLVWLKDKFNNFIFLEQKFCFLFYYLNVTYIVPPKPTLNQSFQLFI